MLKNYLTIALRNLVRYKIYTAINALGLATGIAFCLLTFLYVRHEWTYDQFHEKSDRIFRLGMSGGMFGGRDNARHVWLSEKIGPLMRENIRNSPMLCGSGRVQALYLTAIIPLK